jgi:hypothetical protein
MFNAKQFRSLIVKPTLEALGHWSQDAENLLVMICAWESKGGTYLKQEEGPALGIYMMEPATHDYIWQFIFSKDRDFGMISNVLRASGIPIPYQENPRPNANSLILNFRYSTVMARVFFLRIKEPIPLGLHELGAYAKKYWNTEKGKATPDDYYQAYCHFEGIKS